MTNKLSAKNNAQFAPLGTFNFGRMGIFKYFIIADRNNIESQITLPATVSATQDQITTHMFRTVNISSELGQTEGNNAITLAERIRDIIDSVSDVWKRSKMKLDVKRALNQQKWTNNSFTLNKLRNMILELVDLFASKTVQRWPVLNEVHYVPTFKIASSKLNPGVSKILTDGEVLEIRVNRTILKNKLTTKAWRRQAIMPMLSWLWAFRLTKFFPLIFEMLQVSYAQFAHELTGTDDVEDLLKLILSRLTYSVEDLSKVQVQSLLYFITGLLAAFLVTQEGEGGRPAIVIDDVKELINWDIELNIDDYLTGKRNLLARLENINLGHYPNYASQGSRELYILPIGSPEYITLSILRDHDSRSQDIDVTQLDPIDGWEADGVPFPTQVATLNKEIGIVRDLVNEPRLLDVQSVTPYNLVAQPPENKARIPIKFWQLHVFLNDDGHYLGEVGKKRLDWFYNLDSIYKGNLFLFDPDFEAERETAFQFDSSSKMSQYLFKQSVIGGTLPSVKFSPFKDQMTAATEGA